jgi:putative nucleotidyltransferase with HDIG domain
MAEAYRLPTLPAVHARAMAALNQPDVDVRHLSSIVETDPALTAAVLRAANSAASAPVRRIGTAGEAVLRIGFNTTRRILLGAVIGESFRGLHRAGIDAGELWRHVIACALLADTAAFGGGERSTAFTAGLLHDVGRMAMAQADPIRYSRVAQLARSGMEASEAEAQLFGHDHMEWGVQVARAWSVPDEAIEVIGDHHYGSASPLSWAVCNARRVATALGIGDGLQPAAQPEPGDRHGHGGADDLTDEDWLLIGRVGGPEAFKEQVDWYCGSVAGSTRVPRQPVRTAPLR